MCVQTKKERKHIMYMYVYDLQLLQLVCWSYSICLFRFSLKLSPYLNLPLLTFFSEKFGF